MVGVAIGEERERCSYSFGNSFGNRTVSRVASRSAALCEQQDGRARRDASQREPGPTSAMPTLTVENYLKAILHLEPRPRSREFVSPGRIAETLGLTPGTVTSMMKTLEADGLVRYRPYAGVQLTSRGRKVALHVLRRHRLVELFLVETLGMDWSEVHEEAEELEHAISDRVLERLDAFLGHPAVDPHGDPIPRDGTLPVEDSIPLAETETGQCYRIARLLDQRPEFLEMAERHGLLPGKQVTIREIDDTAGIIRVRIARKDISLSTDVADRVVVSV